MNKYHHVDIILQLLFMSPYEIHINMESAVAHYPRSRYIVRLISTVLDVWNLAGDTTTTPSSILTHLIP